MTFKDLEDMRHDLKKILDEFGHDPGALPDSWDKYGDSHGLMWSYDDEKERPYVVVGFVPPEDVYAEIVNDEHPQVMAGFRIYL